MTNGELHDILDDKNKKISLKEFRDILWELKKDCFDEINKLDVTDTNKTQFYYGSINVLYLALDLSEHIEESGKQ